MGRVVGSVNDGVKVDCLYVDCLKGNYVSSNKTCLLVIILCVMGS